MSTSLGATIEQAQAAFDNGDYRSVVDSCTNIIDQYPDYGAAQRLLGLAYLEQGEGEEAEAWFARLLTREPRDPSAYLGLGLVAEDRGVLDHALAYCQVAWELAPYDARFREPMNRVAEKRYGSDGRLRLTHAALAQIHANGARLRRAVKEYQSALIALPDRLDLWMGLAETLWMLGENADAAEIAREFLKEHEDLVPALVILTDLEHRAGDADAALEYRNRLRRLDPDGAVTASMIQHQPYADADFLAVQPDEQPVIEDRVDAVVVSERPQFAPAPDFTVQEEAEPDADADIDDLQPMTLEEFSDELPGLPEEPASSSYAPDMAGMDEPDTVEVEPVSAEASMEDIAGHFADEPEDATPPEGAVSDEADGIASINLLDMDLGEDPTPPFSDEPVDDAELGDLLQDLEGVEPMSLEDFGASDDEPAAAKPGFFEDSDIDFDIRIEDPDAVQIGGGPPKAAPGMFGAGLSNMSEMDDDFPEIPEVDESGGDSEIADADRGTVLLGDAAEAEPEAAGARPPERAPAPPGSGFTRLLGELGNEGLAPFDPTRTATGMGQSAGNEDSDEGQLFPSLADGWDDIDAQLASATPGGGADAGDLTDIDDLGLEPFTLDDDDMDFAERNESASQSRSPAAPEPRAAAQPEPEPPSETPDTVGGLDDVPGLEPFDLEEFEEVEESAPFDFSVLPWEQQDTASGFDIQEIFDEVAGAAPDDADLRSPELPEGADRHLDVTQELAGGSLDPQFEQRMAEVEQAARDNLDRMQASGSEDTEPEQASAIEQVDEPHASVFTPTAAQMVVDRDLFERTRQAKTTLVEQGTIDGIRELPGLPASEASEPEPIETVDEPAIAASEPEAPPAEPEHDAGEAQPAANFEESSEEAADLSAVQEAVESNPDDGDVRWQYAETLIARGEYDSAMTEYHWLIRHDPGRHDAIIASLEECVDNGREAELAHRLLADIYRRRGDSAQARNHASMAMAARRLMRGART